LNRRGNLHAASDDKPGHRHQKITPNERPGM
jgi:hypothetical protein